jgi:hypothetical protein
MYVHRAPVERHLKEKLRLIIEELCSSADFPTLIPRRLAYNGTWASYLKPSLLYTSPSHGKALWDVTIISVLWIVRPTQVTEPFLLTAPFTVLTVISKNHSKVTPKLVTCYSNLIRWSTTWYTVQFTVSIHQLPGLSKALKLEWPHVWLFCIFFSVTESKISHESQLFFFVLLNP